MVQLLAMLLLLLDVTLLYLAGSATTSHQPALPLDPLTPKYQPLLSPQSSGINYVVVALFYCPLVQQLLAVQPAIFDGPGVTQATSSQLLAPPAASPLHQNQPSCPCDQARRVVKTFIRSCLAL